MINGKGDNPMTNDTFNLNDTYVVVAGESATTLEGGEPFWRRLATRDPELAAADGGWLVSSYVMTEDWPNWEMHPSGDEIVHCEEGACEFVIEQTEGTREIAMAPGKTVVVPRGTWHRARVDKRVQLLHITYGSGTTFKPAG
jgi:mannose-6-phosphate isomerase-like protein (cupin superfamily)